MRTFAQYKDELKNRKESSTPGVPMTYFQEETANNQCKDYQDRLAKSELEGKAAAKQITNDSRDFTVENHEHARAQVAAATSKGTTVEKECIAFAQHQNKVHPIEYENKAYEAKVLSSYDNGKGSRIRYQRNTLDDSAIVDKYLATMQAKWDANGYSNDLEDTADFFAGNALSQFTPANPAPSRNVSPGVLKPASY